MPTSEQVDRPRDVSPPEVARALSELAAQHGEDLPAGADPDLLAEARGLLAVARDAGVTIPAAVAWRWGFAHHLRGEYPRAAEFFESADAASAPVGDRSRLLSAHASTLWASGEAPRAARLADAALVAAREARDDAALADAWVAQALISAAEGDRAANVRAYQHALEHARRAGDVLTEVRVRSNLGSMHIEEGRYLAALDELDLAVELADAARTGVVGALAYINRAEALTGLGRLDEARAEIELAERLYRSAESPLLDFAVLLDADIHRLRGSAARASAGYREVLERSASTGNAQLRSAALSGLARTTIGADAVAARGYAHRAVTEPAALGEVGALLADGWVALAVGEAGRALLRAEEAVGEAGRRHDLPSLADGLELAAIARWTTARSKDVDSDLAEAAEIWSETGNRIRLAMNRLVRARLSGDRGAEEAGRRALEVFGVRVDAFRIAGPLWVVGPPSTPTVAVRTLGSFDLLIDGEPVPTSAWRSRKSRQIVKLLAARGGRRVSRDELCDTLWPGETGTRARLSVGLSNARATLDPGRRHDPGRFLHADREQVWLDPTEVAIDVVEFEALAEAGLRAARSGDGMAVVLLQAAAARYTGPFLADEAPDDWVIEVRDRVRATAGSVKRALARLLTRDDPERAVGWWVSVLRDDPYDEEAHLELIRALASARRHGEARRARRVYVARMAELGVAPQVVPLPGPRPGPRQDDARTMYR